MNARQAAVLENKIDRLAASLREMTKAYCSLLDGPPRGPSGAGTERSAAFKRAIDLLREHDTETPGRIGK